MLLFPYYDVKCLTLILHFSNKNAWSPPKRLLKYSDNAHHTELCIINFFFQFNFKSLFSLNFICIFISLQHKFWENVIKFFK